MWKTEYGKPGRSSEEISGDPPQVNGYAAMSALIIFALIIQLCLFACICIRQSTCLAAACRQSKMDLAVYDQAKSIAESNAYYRRCHLMDDSFIESREIEIEERTVRFTDQQTFIQAEYELNGEMVCVQIFYDETGIADLKYV